MRELRAAGKNIIELAQGEPERRVAGRGLHISSGFIAPGTSRPDPGRADGPAGVMFAARQQIGIVRRRTRDRFEFGDVGGQQRRAGVARVVGALGIDQHTLAGSTRAPDQRGHFDQGALAVVGTDHDVAIIQALRKLLPQRRTIEGARLREGLLEIHAQQLLVARHHAQLGDRRVIG